MKSLELLIDDARCLGFEPRVHPNGFMQLDLDEGRQYRMHIWDEALPRQEVSTPIHDHDFKFASFIYLGALENAIFDVRQAPDGTHKKWTVVRQSGSDETQLATTDERYAVREIGTEILGAGDSYVLDPQTFHESRHIGRSLSIMQKLARRAELSASVMIPVGMEPDNTFRRSVHDRAELWDLAYETARQVRFP